MAHKINLVRASRYLVPFLVAFMGANTLSMRKALSLESQVCLNELLPIPCTGQNEFIELYNPDPSPADISGWVLEVKLGSFVVSSRTLPPGTTIEAMGFHLEETDSMLPDMQTGVCLYLLDDEEGYVDSYCYNSPLCGFSAGRCPDGEAGWHLDLLPSAGETNICTTPTPSPTMTSTPTASPSATATHTASPSPTATFTPSPSSTASPTATQRPSSTPTPTPTETTEPSPTATHSPTDTPSRTSTATHTPTASPSRTNTAIVTPTAAPSQTGTVTITSTATPSPTGTALPTPTSSRTSTVTVTPTASPSRTNTATVTPTATPSPTNTETPTPSVTPSRTPVIPGSVCLSEFLPAPGSIRDWDGDGEANYMDEWIELHNAWNVPIDLGDWMLGDDEKLYILPQGTLLAPGEYHVFYRRDTKIILNNEGQDKVRLLSPEGTLLDEVSYEDAGYDVSYSRLNGCLGEWVTTLPPSPGEANHPPGQPPGYNAVWLPLIRRH